MAEVWTPAAFDYFTASLVDVAEMNALNNSLRFLKQVYSETFTADVNVTATTEATANTIVPGASQTYEAVPHLLTFQAMTVRPDAAAAGRAIIFCLYDGTSIGKIGQITTPAAAAMLTPVHLDHPFTPTAAAHTYSIRAYVSAGTGIVFAGAGGVGNNMPGFLRIVRVPT